MSGAVGVREPRQERVAPSRAGADASAPCSVGTLRYTRRALLAVMFWLLWGDAARSCSGRRPAWCPCWRCSASRSRSATPFTACWGPGGARAFDWQPPAGRASDLVLDLGVVHETARVRLNGKDLGVSWCFPWRLPIGDALKTGTNQLEIEVVNLWPNRLIGDATLPPEKRLARTNVAYYSRPPKKGGPHRLLESGLLGPVTVCAQRED